MMVGLWLGFDSFNQLLDRYLKSACHLEYTHTHKPAYMYVGYDGTDL